MIKIKRGLDLPIDGKPDPSIKDPVKVTKVAVVGVDFPGLKPTMLVEVGDKVKKGQPLFEDKKNPGVLFTAPEAGTVAEINRGEKRAFLSLVIETDPSLGAEKFKSYESKEIEKLSKEDVQDQLIKSGAWVYLKTRPFAKTPKIGSEPNAIFVTAMDTNPLAPDAALIIKDNEKAFLDGIAVMSRLAKTVYVCKGEGSLPLSNISNVKEETFVGPHPAGLAGTHMHFLEGASLNNMLWYINYQDVIAIGKLFSTGLPAILMKASRELFPVLFCTEEKQKVLLIILAVLPTRLLHFLKEDSRNSWDGLCLDSKNSLSAELSSVRLLLKNSSLIPA